MLYIFTTVKNKKSVTMSGCGKLGVVPECQINESALDGHPENSMK